MDPDTTHPGDGDDSDEATTVEAVIHRRASSLLVDPDAPVDAEILVRLVEAAQAAPNHKTTRPLRVAILRGEARGDLGAAVAAAMVARDEAPERVAKARTKYLRAPVVLVVASAPGSTEHETLENDYAVAAGIQNLLLLAESMGLACLWSSPAKGASEAICGASGLDARDKVIGIVYVGWPTKRVAPKPRPEPPIVWRG